MTSNNTQYEVGLKISKDLIVREITISLLSSASFDLSLLVEEEGRKQRKLSFYTDQKTRAAEWFKLLKAFNVRGAEIFKTIHRRKDWESRWKKGWKPFSLTRRFYVVPLWQDDRRIPPGKEAIFLDTTNAFGTGLHETTRFTSQLIERLEGKVDSFLDVGTGTGILAIVALKCGARHVMGFDIDSSAIKVARDNLKANGLRCALKRADAATFRSGKIFDLVAANLVSPDLMAFRDRIVSLVKPNGHLIISGISLGNLSKVKRSFSVTSMKVVRIIKGREWAAILFFKQSGQE